MQELLKALLPGFTDGDMHMPAHKLAILISREKKGLSGSYFYFSPYMPALFFKFALMLMRVSLKERSASVVRSPLVTKF